MISTLTIDQLIVVIRNLNLRYVDKHGNNPIHILCMQAYRNSEVHKAINAFKESGQDLDLKNANGQTPLDFAFGNKNALLVHALLDAGATHVKSDLVECMLNEDYNDELLKLALQTNADISNVQTSIYDAFPILYTLALAY